MAFDWFRRHQEKEAEPEKQPEKQVEQPEQASEQPDAAATSQEDYLNWAKVAYQAIQKRQQQEGTPASAAALGSEPIAAAEMEASEPPTPEGEESAPPAPPMDETVVTAAETPLVSESADLTCEPEVEEVTTVAALTESEAVSAVAEAPTEPPQPAAPLPFWAKAEADRLTRLEQLRETAIVDTTPAAPPASSEITQPTPVSPFQTKSGPTSLEAELTLDEGFLWSAEILAAQGLRPDEISLEEITWLKQLRQGLDKTRRGLVNQLKAIVGQGPLNQDAVFEIEAALLQADVGVEATDAIIAALETKVKNDALPPDAAITYLKQILRDMLDAPLQASQNGGFAPQKDQLNIWLMTGVNGAGKTTTIGKLAHLAQKSGYNCLIAAADTFRAAAVEQVKVWGRRSNVEVIANPGQNTDPAAVVFDAIAAAQARGTELLLVDTAGRLQNKKNLMDELSKIRRIVDKKAPDAKIEALLVLDATLGQNGLRQAEVFSEAAKLSGVVLTKLDGTARGGIALAIVQQLGLPIRFIGAGEGIEDLRPFSSFEFVEALLSG
ncbi:MAG: signal recognition particle-docking protein FtsY [Leptolyngbyaceae cyanobacterium]